jgi:gliding motility-associated-like protein
MKYLLMLLAMPFCTALLAQPTAGLIAYYSFDNTPDTILVDDNGNLANNGFSTALDRGCGVVGNAIRFDGQGERVVISSSFIDDAFSTDDLTVSFYFKSLNTNLANTQTIMHKRVDCSNQNAFAIRYSPNTGSFNVVFSEDLSLSTIITQTVDPSRCWHHVALVREGPMISLYLDGVLVDTDTKATRIDLTSLNIPFALAESSCTSTDAYFEGFLDELRIYGRALTDNEVRTLYLLPDRIGNGFRGIGQPKDTILFLGNDMATFITNTCATSFQWVPSTGVDDPSDPYTFIEPTVTTTYTLNFTDDFGCTASDSINVKVIDPDELECKAFVPSAFTPNGDGRNDSFGIDNPFTLQDFVSLEIFDRWGGRMFFSEDPFERWDGSIRGQAVNPGVYLYKVIYLCDGEEVLDSGSITVIR